MRAARKIVEANILVDLVLIDDRRSNNGPSLQSYSDEREAGGRGRWGKEVKS